MVVEFAVNGNQAFVQCFVFPPVSKTMIVLRCLFKLQLHDEIYLLRFYSNSLSHILSLSNSHNNVESLQNNRGDKSHRVIVALTLFKPGFFWLSMTRGGGFHPPPESNVTVELGQ